MGILGKADLLESFTRTVPLLPTVNLVPPAPGPASRSPGGVKLVPAKLMAAPGRLSRDVYLVLPALMVMCSSIVLVAREKHGVEWAQLVKLLTVVDANDFLREWDCDQA